MSVNAGLFVVEMDTCKM